MFNVEYSSVNSKKKKRKRKWESGTIGGRNFGALNDYFIRLVKVTCFLLVNLHSGELKNPFILFINFGHRILPTSIILTWNLLLRDKHKKTTFFFNILPILFLQKKCLQPSYHTIYFLSTIDRKTTKEKNFINKNHMALSPK